MNGLPFTNANGDPDVLPWSEFDAVEITGRSTWQDYRRYHTTWPQQHVQVLSLMERRPGAVEPGKRPAEVVYATVRMHQLPTAKELQFVRLMSHMTAVNIGIVLGRGTNFVRHIRELENIRTGYIWGNSEEEMNTARMMWAKWNTDAA